MTRGPHMGLTVAGSPCEALRRFGMRRSPGRQIGASDQGDGTPGREASHHPSLKNGIWEVCIDRIRRAAAAISTSSSVPGVDGSTRAASEDGGGDICDVDKGCDVMDKPCLVLQACCNVLVTCRSRESNAYSTAIKGLSARKRR